MVENIHFFDMRDMSSKKRRWSQVKQCDVLNIFRLDKNTLQNTGDEDNMSFTKSAVPCDLNNLLKDSKVNHLDAIIYAKLLYWRTQRSTI